MTFTAVLKRMAVAGWDLHLTTEHNGWMHLTATRKETGAPLLNREGEIISASQILYGDREYNVLSTLDRVASMFWRKYVEAYGVRPL